MEIVDCMTVSSDGHHILSVLVRLRHIRASCTRLSYGGAWL